MEPLTRRRVHQSERDKIREQSPLCGVPLWCARCPRNVACIKSEPRMLLDGRRSRSENKGLIFVETVVIYLTYSGATGHLNITERQRS